MKNMLIALNRRYEGQFNREAFSRLHVLSFLFIAMVLLVSATGCGPANTSRWLMAGNSMEPNLSDGQMLTAEVVKDRASLQHGDIVIFEWEGKSLVKRIVGLPGETIEIRHATLLVNGEVYEEPYELVAAEYDREPVTLGEDQYYVLGDNRNASRDSHNFGPITSEMIEGRVILDQNEPVSPSPTP